ncbi:MAG: aconitase family protein, partial [Candidatus Bathyarchaeia archaeon]
SDPDAAYEKKLEYSVDELEPQVACPHTVDNVKPVAEVGKVEIQEAFLGSCTNARLEDLRIAAEMLKGRKVKNGVRMIVTPASQEIYGQALREGLFDVFLAAGAYVTGSTCGACIGRHQGVPADDEAVVSTANRNFPGRMGNSKAKVYLASPATVAASAILGRLAHPKEADTR